MTPLSKLRTSPHAPTALWAAGILVGAGSTPLAWQLRELPPIVLGPLPIPDPWLAVMALLALGGVALLVAATRLRRAQEADGIREPRARAPRALVAVVSTLAVAFGVLAGSLAMLLFSGAAYLLDPPSASGARVLVVHHAFLLLGGGDVYLVEPWSPVPRHLYDYLTDDGYDPAYNHDYTLSWTGDVPHVTLGGT